MALITILLICCLHLVTCTDERKCKFENVVPNQKPGDLGSINDTYRGEIAVYKTTNIVKVEVLNNDYDYFNVTWKNQTLFFATGENFDKYESENDYTKNPAITVILKCKCLDDYGKTQKFTLIINDTNNHKPELNQANFQYILATTIPKNYALTDLLPISAVEMDISNSELYFDIPRNNYLKIEETVQVGDNSKSYNTKLVALQELSAPFDQIFELIVTDSGNPPSNTTATIVVKVVNPDELLTEGNTTEIHPPVFGNHLYFAYYTTSHKIEMEEPITITYGVTNSTTLKQIGYETYFNLTLENATVTVNLVKQLSQKILEDDFIVIEIEAINPGLETITGRTALIIEFSGRESSNECEIRVFGQEFGYPMILMISGILAIVLINLGALAIFFKKQKRAHLKNQI